MSFQIPSRTELSIHEAAHAYAFASLVRLEEPEELGLGVDGKGNATGWCARKRLLLTEIPLEKATPTIRSHIEWNAAAEVVIAMAGPISEFRLRFKNRVNTLHVALINIEKFLEPGALDVDGDFERVRATFDYLKPIDQIATFKPLIEAAEKIVAANWASIRKLGQELDRRGLLGADDLEAWFERRPAKPHILQPSI